MPPATVAKVKPSAKEWLQQNWRVVLALLVMFLTIRWLISPNLSFIVALIGALVLLGTHVQARQWKWMVLWLVFPFCGVASVAFQIGTADAVGNPGILPRLLLLGLAITGFVIEMRATSQKRRQLQQADQPDPSPTP